MTDEPVTTPTAAPSSGMPGTPAPGSEPTAPDAPAPERPRRRPSRRTVVLLAAAGAVLVAGGTVATVLLVRDAEHRAALAEFADARAAVATASEALDQATADRATAETRLTDTRAAVDATVAAASGAVDSAVVGELQTAATDADAAATAVGAPADAPAIPDATEPAAPDELPADQLRALAADLAADAEDITAGADAIAEGSAELTDAADALDTASSAFAAAVAEAGAAILTDRADAADDVKATLQTQLDALPDVGTADLAAAITAYRAAADEVITSSDRARAPQGGGPGFIVPDAASLTVVVNKQRALPADYIPANLVVPEGVPNTNGQPMRADAAAAMQSMAAGAAAEGITLRIASGYRSYATQRSVYNRYVASEGVAGADTHSARPGHSEHQTGLVADIDDGTGCSIQTCFASKPGGVWLAANSWQYGFILRYGDGWTPIVGYMFEPWHYRYVGVDVATDMHERGIRTLEEYYGLPAAPDY